MSIVKIYGERSRGNDKGKGLKRSRVNDKGKGLK